MLLNNLCSNGANGYGKWYGLVITIITWLKYFFSSLFSISTIVLGECPTDLGKYKFVKIYNLSSEFSCSIQFIYPILSILSSNSFLYNFFCILIASS